MAINLPIISEWNPKGIDKAIADFKKLETNGQKASFAIKKAAVPAGLAVAALGTFLVGAAKGAEEARIADEKLASVLDTMGFEDATQRVSAYAESLEKTIAVDADVIKATQTKLATFSALTKTVDTAGGAFDRATAAALDMAAAGFGTAEGNAVQLGKALQDPIKGIAALAKSGVTFTKQEKKKIEALVESGNLLEAQNIILKAVEGQVGGTAAASASSFDKMKFALAGVSDTFGEMLLPAIDKLAPKLAAFTAWASENSTLLAVLVGVFGGLAVAILAVNVAMKVWTATTAAFTAVQAAFNAVMALNPIFLIVAAIVAVIAILVVLQKQFGIFDGVIRVVGAAFGAVWQAIKTVFDWVKNNWPLLLAVLTGPFGTAILAITTFKDQIINAFSIIYNGIKATMGFIANVITAPFKAAFNGIAKLWNNTVGSLSFTVPSWVPSIGGKGFNVPDIPELKDGGIVTQATLAMIGEGNEPEAIIPLSKLASMGFGNGGGGNITVNVNGGDPNSIVRALQQYVRQSGPVPVNTRAM
jgi:SLT domain-containing protein